MNERIKELVKQAGGHCNTHNLASNPVQYRESVELWDDRIEKFAELIVRECMAMCKTAVGNADYNTGRLHCLNNIKEHFGVEE
jgi:hypothetical protein